MTFLPIGEEKRVSAAQLGLAQYRFQSLRLLAQALDAYDERSADDFCSLIDTVLENRFSANVLSAEFKVSLATISRWRSGATAPLPYVRGVIIRRVREMLNVTLAELQTGTKEYCLKEVA